MHYRLTNLILNDLLCGCSCVFGTVLAALKVVQMENSLFINQVKMLLARIDIKMWAIHTKDYFR